MALEEAINKCEDNVAIFDAFCKCDAVFKDDYKKIACSVSGGADSDLMVDMLYQMDLLDKVELHWFNTGFEYQATKDHLDYLEQKYNTTIKRLRAFKPIPLAVKETGLPFISKFVSEMIERLQKHNFDWKDGTFEELYKKYPKCKVPIRWWTNDFPVTNFGVSKFNIHYTKYLKEFLIENPPTFKISNKCCLYAKKKTAHKYDEENGVDLKLIGIRKAEGGIRSAAYKNCFSQSDDVSEYRPLFWFTNKDKEDYERLFNVTHSRCYTEYGMTRTGCAGCPFSRTFEDDLQILQTYEPKLYKGVTKVFGVAHEYTRKFNEFKKQMKEKEEKDDITGK